MILTLIVLLAATATHLTSGFVVVLSSKPRPRWTKVWRRSAWLVAIAAAVLVGTLLVDLLAETLFDLMIGATP